DQPRGHAVGLRLAGLRHDHALVALAEDAAKELLLVFTEVVVAQAGGEVPLVGQRHGALAEKGELVQLVRQLGEEETVRRRERVDRRSRGNAAECREARDGKVLAGVAVW